MFCKSKLTSLDIYLQCLCRKKFYTCTFSRTDGSVLDHALSAFWLERTFQIENLHKDKNLASNVPICIHYSYRGKIHVDSSWGSLLHEGGFGFSVFAKSNHVLNMFLLHWKEFQTIWKFRYGVQNTPVRNSILCNAIYPQLH